MKKYLLFIISFIGFNAYCQDAYQYVTTGIDHIKYYVKVESVDKSNHQVRLSLKGVLPESKTIDNKGKSSSGGVSEISSFVFHLNDRTYDTLDYVAYSATGELLDSGYSFDVAQTIYPNSLLAEIFDSVNSTLF